MVCKRTGAARYTASQNELLATLESRGHDIGEIRTFLDQPEAVLLEGQLLYPRLFRRGEGMASVNPWPAYAIRDYSRIGSILLNATRSDSIFITKDLLDFQHGVDVIVLACKTDRATSTSA